MPLVKITPITAAVAGMGKDLVDMYNTYQMSAALTATVDDAVADVRSKLVVKYPAPAVVWSVDHMKKFFVNMQKTSPSKCDMKERMHEIDHKIKKYKRSIVTMVTEYSNMQSVIRDSSKVEEEYLLDKTSRTVSAYMKVKRAVDQAKHKYDMAADTMVGLKLEMDILMLEVDIMLGGLFTSMTAAHKDVDTAKLDYLKALEEAKTFEDGSVLGIGALKDIDDRNDSDSDSDCDAADDDINAIEAEKKALWDVVVAKNDIVSDKMDVLHRLKNSALMMYSDEVVEMAVDIFNDNPSSLSDDLVSLNATRKQRNDAYNEALKAKLVADNAFDVTFRKKCKKDDKEKKHVEKHVEESSDDDSDCEVECHKKDKKNKCHKKDKKKCHKKKHDSDSESDSDSDSSSSDEEYTKPVPIPPKPDPQFSDLVLKLILDIIKPK